MQSHAKMCPNPINKFQCIENFRIKGECGGMWNMQPLRRARHTTDQKGDRIYLLECFWNHTKRHWTPISVNLIEKKTRNIDCSISLTHLQMWNNLKKKKNGIMNYKAFGWAAHFFIISTEKFYQKRVWMNLTRFICFSIWIFHVWNQMHLILRGTIFNAQIECWMKNWNKWWSFLSEQKKCMFSIYFQHGI